MIKIGEYVKLNDNQKQQALKREAIFVEKYPHGHNTVNVYFLNGFFVEVTERDGKVLDNIPYKSRLSFTGIPSGRVLEPRICG